jgi:hypothetical protein
MESGTMFRLLNAQDRNTVERHHSRFGMHCEWIIQVKMTREYDSDSSKPMS